MHEIVNNMLDMAKIDNDALQMSWDKVSLGALLSDLVGAVQRQMGEREVAIHVSEGLSSLPFINGDSVWLKKIFEHLLLNGIKYTPDGGEIWVEGAVHGDEEAVEIQIKDSGIGIDLELQKLIFKKFYQTGEVALHSSGKMKFKGGGPGLGLAIARGVVEAHGGRLWVESEGCDEERLPGSTFFVVLPLQNLE
ncbi:MAG TPA: HAMP domain-containing sensor histidine kinase [Anaerolineae bacterium]|nr:HAMP domain-containing sensor histidine kinase [Anaerolineae bacterium]